MSTALAIDLSSWDLGSKLSLVTALAQSVDEFVGMVTETQIIISDPDWPDKRSASHRFVDHLYDAIQNFIAEPTLVQTVLEAMPANATRAEAEGVLARILPGGGKLKDALAWVFDHLDEFMEYVLPWLLLILDKTPKLAPLRGLLRLPRLRAA
jgi:hypothetical protein